MSHSMQSYWLCWLSVNKWNNWMCNVLQEAEVMCFKLGLKTFVLIRLNQIWEVTRQVNLNAPPDFCPEVQFQVLCFCLRPRPSTATQLSISLHFVCVWSSWCSGGLGTDSVHVAQIKDCWARLHENNNLITGNNQVMIIIWCDVFTSL